MKMKGSINISTELLVVIVVAVVILLAALWMFGLIPGVLGEQTYTGAFQACCVSYNLDGNCKGTPDYSYECLVGTDIRDSGKISIAELAQLAHRSPDDCCPG